MAVTPIKGTATIITTGNTPVLVFPPNINGGYIINPVLAADQGVTPEWLYASPVVTNPGLLAIDTVIGLQPGQRWDAIPLSSLPVYANAASSGHKFTAIYW